MVTQPDYAVATGDFIEEWLDQAGINAAELARRLDVSPKHVSELRSGKAPLSHDVAFGLERVTQIPATFWNQTEAFYRIELARLAEKAKLAAQHEQAKLFPLNYLRKWNFITASAKDKAQTVSQLLSILGIADLRSFDATWVHVKVAYRKVAVKYGKAPEMATWLALGEQDKAWNGNLPNFNKDALEQELPELRTLTAEPDQMSAIRSAIARLHGAGVVLSLIPPIPGLGVHGATRWINGHPLIQLSLHGKTNDQMWFTLFHEIGHVLLHGSSEVFLFGADTDAEKDANQFASETLIPPACQYRLPAGRDLQAVIDLADELGIAASVVLGQAQRRTGDYSWGHKLKVKFEWKPGAEET